jgi:hypothetical protein
MKIIKQIYSELLKSQATERDGKHDPTEAARLRLQAQFQFWIPWLTVLDPLSGDSGVAFGIEDIFFMRGRGWQSGAEVVAGMNMIKESLKLSQLRFGTFFKLRGILREACQKAVSQPNIDIALCALLVLVQLELGSDPDPEYGNFPRPPFQPRPFCDGNLSDNPVEAAIELEIANDMSDPISSSEYRCMVWFRHWEETIEDAAKFEEAFPGAAHRRAHVLRAVRPIFEHLDPIVDSEVLHLFLEWAKSLLRSPLEESLVAETRNSAGQSGLGNSRPDADITHTAS